MTTSFLESNANVLTIHEGERAFPHPLRVASVELCLKNAIAGAIVHLKPPATAEFAGAFKAARLFSASGNHAPGISKG